MNAARYFAYGSNLHPLRLAQRAPSCRAVAVGWLPGHALRFHKRGHDGSGKCNVAWTGRAADRVWGVVYALDGSELVILDRIEGERYRRRQLTVCTRRGPLAAATYVARPEHTDDRLLPYRWYRTLVACGARLHGLPPSWIARIDAVAERSDPDRRRALHHLRLALEVPHDARLIAR